MSRFTHSRSAALAAVGLLAAVPAFAQGGSPRVTVDNAPVPFAGQQPVDDQGHVMVPLRGVFEKMGAKVGYDAPSRKITAKSDKSTIEMNVGSSTATVNGQPTPLNAPVKITNGAVLVPIRFLSESLGSSVKFDKDSQTVLVDTSKTPAPSQAAPDAAGVKMAQAMPESTPAPTTGTTNGTQSPGQPGNGQPASSQPASGQPNATMPTPQPMQSAPTTEQPAPMQTAPAPMTNSAPVQSAPTPMTAPAPVQTAPAPAIQQPQTVTVVDATPETSYAWVPWVIGVVVLLGILAWYLNRRGKTGQVIAAGDDKRP